MSKLRTNSLFHNNTIVSAIIVDDKNQLLIVNNRDKKSMERWTLPGGKVEERETFQKAIFREVKEETSYSIISLGIAYIQESFFVSHQIHVSAIIFKAKIDPSYATKSDHCDVLNDPHQTVIAKRWVPVNELSSYMKNPKILSPLEEWLKERKTVSYLYIKDMEW